MEYDQHFLTDKKIISEIKKNLSFIEEKTVLEIGPGKGAITELLTKNAKKTLIIEIDNKLINHLENLDVELFVGDAIKIINKVEYDCIVSNLPYSITEPLFKKLLRNPKEMLLLLGSNFKKLIDKKTKLGMAINDSWNMQIILEIEKKSFSPPPKTKSLLIKFSPKENTGIITELFNQHDKKVKNAIINYYRRKGMTNVEARKKIELIPEKLLEQNMDKISTNGFKKILEFVQIR